MPEAIAWTMAVCSWRLKLSTWRITDSAHDKAIISALSSLLSRSHWLGILFHSFATVSSWNLPPTHHCPFGK